MSDVLLPHEFPNRAKIAWLLTSALMLPAFAYAKEYVRKARADGMSAAIAVPFILLFLLEPLLSVLPVNALGIAGGVQLLVFLACGLLPGYMVNTAPPKIMNPEGHQGFITMLLPQSIAPLVPVIYVLDILMDVLTPFVCLMQNDMARGVLLTGIGVIVSCYTGFITTVPGIASEELVATNPNSRALGGFYTVSLTAMGVMSWGWLG
jgi:hypothetical protein